MVIHTFSRSLLVRIVAPDQGLDESFVAGESHGVTDFGQPFHMASVGKHFQCGIDGNVG
jgi:hypothetical protein